METKQAMNCRNGYIASLLALWLGRFTIFPDDRYYGLLVCHSAGWRKGTSVFTWPSTWKVEKKNFRWNLGTANSRLLDFSWCSSNISFCVSHKEFIYYVFIFILFNSYVISDYACEVWGYLSSIHEDSSLRGEGRGGGWVVSPYSFLSIVTIWRSKTSHKIWNVRSYSVWWQNKIWILNCLFVYNFVIDAVGNSCGICGGGI